MAVKSSTKKRLIELGIPEDHAHRLADDAQSGHNQEDVQGTGCKKGRP